MKKLFILLLVLLYACEKDTVKPLYEICKECTTIELTTDDEPIITVVFACGEEDIAKREKLNYHEVNSDTHKTTIWMTTCIKLNTKNN